MKYLLKKIYKKTLYLKFSEYDSIYANYLLDNSLVNPKIKHLVRLKYFPNHIIYMSQWRKRCIISNYKSTYRYFLISRICLRFLGLNGIINGLKKSSW